LAVDSPPPSQASIAQAIQEVSERATVIVREEIELAKAEVTQSLTKLVKGAVVGIAAGIFAIFGLVFLLHGFSWLAYDLIPFGEGDFYWGFFVVAAVLFLLGGLAGFLAARALKAGSDPAPRMAMEEARLIKETVQSHEKRSQS
jgi:hypothetical protein